MCVRWAAQSAGPLFAKGQVLAPVELDPRTSLPGASEGLTLQSAPACMHPVNPDAGCPSSMTWRWCLQCRPYELVMLGLGGWVSSASLRCLNGRLAWSSAVLPEQALVLEAVRDLREGEIVYMDYGASGAGEAGEKLDGQVLLDYGAFDAGSNQVWHLVGAAPGMLQKRWQPTVRALCDKCLRRQGC